MASPRQLHQDVISGKFEYLYYFYGSEDYRRSEAEKFVAEHFLPDLQRATNYQKLDARRSSAKELMAALSNLPMLGNKEVYIINDFQSYRAAEQDQIFKLLKQPDTNRIVILNSSSAKTPDKKTAFFKKVSGIACTVEFRKLRADETQSLIKRRLSEHKLNIENDALQLLTGLVDGDRGGLESELNKLIDFTETEETITEATIKKVCSAYEFFNMFQVGDVLVEGKSHKTLKVIHNLMGSGTSADTLIILLQQHFTSLYLVKNGKGPVGRRGFLIPKFRAQATNFSNLQLEKAIISIAEANANIRYQKMPPAVILETLALSLSGQN